MLNRFSNLNRCALQMNNIYKSSIMTNQMRNFAIIMKYTKTHEWIRYNSDTKKGKLGITDFAQHELGDIVHVELPAVGGTHE